MTEPTSPLPSGSKNVWYELWFVPGAIAFLGGLVVLLLEAILGSGEVRFPLLGSVSLLLSLMLFSVGWTLENHRDRIERRIQEVAGELAQNLRSDLAGIASELRQPYLIHLKEELLRRARQPLLQLAMRGERLSRLSSALRS
jgi:hypothetical protein